MYAKMAYDTSRVNISKGKMYALKSFQLAKECQDNELLLKSSKTLGILYKILEDIDSSQYYSIIGIEYADKIPDKRTAAALTTLVALTYVDYGQYGENQYCRALFGKLKLMMGTPTLAIMLQ